VTYTLMPWLEIWEQAANRSLFTPAERKRYFCEHNVAGLLRGDLDSGIGPMRPAGSGDG
jgi:phage portal protein BeeE